MEKSEIGKSGDGFIDRSKARILLCDNVRFLLSCASVLIKVRFFDCMLRATRMDKGKNIGRSQLDCDPSKVRILLCDLDAESCQEVLSLLCKHSYQAAVWSAAEVFDTLISEGPRAHIILAEVNLLMANDARIMRYIMREKRLQHIPVIILTTKDQVSITIKGLRLGAADYLVKPLQDDEISNLWMHISKFR